VGIKVVTEVVTGVEIEATMEVVMELAPKLATSATSPDIWRENVSTTQTRPASRGKMIKTKTRGITTTEVTTTTTITITTAVSSRPGLVNIATNRVTGIQTVLT
jgi:hypothetical protein